MELLDPELATPLAFALTAGVVTFFSPCAYPLLPGYVGYYVNHTQQAGSVPTLGGAVARGVVAAGGVLVTFGILIGVAFQIGYSTLEGIELFELIVGVVLVLFGALVLFDRAPSLSIALPKRRSGVIGFGIFGAGYALAAAGCVVPVFIGVVGLALSMSSAPAALVLGTYVGSVALLMLGLTVATGMGLLAGAGRLAAHTRRLQQIAGAIMIIAGVGQLYLALFVLEVI